MHKNNKGNRERQYFYITEDEPVQPIKDRLKTGLQVKLPRENHFYIDFLDECKLRLMSKVDNRDSDFAKPLVTEKYGRNIVTNIEDSSVPQQKLTKFLEERTQFRQKKYRIRSRLKGEIDKSTQKVRSRSLFAIKQEMLDYYNFPVAIETDGQKDKKSQFLQRSQRQRQRGLNKLGLIRHF